METIENYIGGNLVKPASDTYLETINPSTGEVYAHAPDSDDRDVNLAVDAANAAFLSWSELSAEARHGHLMRLVALIERDMEALAVAESVDNGKPLLLARTVDIPRAVS